MLTATVAAHIILGPARLETVDHGQVCFALIVAAFCGALAAHQFYSPRLTAWIPAAVVLLALVGYLWGAADPSAPMLPYPDETGAWQRYNRLSGIPPNSLAHASPAEFVMAGLVGGLSGLWFSRRLHASRQEQDG